MPDTEVRTLLDRLDAQQQRVVGILADLDDAAMHQVLLPSGWSCAGMVQHLTLTTRFWLEAVMSGLDDRVVRGDDVVDDFDVTRAGTGQTLVTAYAGACRVGARLVRGLPPTTPPTWWPEGRWGPWRLHDLREVLVHLLVETSTHAGHLDVVRELIDGRTWDYPRGQLTASAS